MSASEGKRQKIASRCIVEADQCTHVFDIAGYSLLKGIDAGKVIRSAAFVAGGCEWCIRFYPDGYSAEDSGGYVAIFLELLTNAEVRVLFDFRLCRTPKVFKAAHFASGSNKFMKRSDLEAAQYLQNDRLVIECNVTVIMGTPAVFITEQFIQVPPSDLPAALGKYLDSGKRADVTFKVKDEVFHAHKFVLALWSPFFEAEFYGPMKDKAMQSITVEDVQPDVFKALLVFIYTESLPGMDDDLDEVESQEMIKHLLVAADRYAMERMKLMCESILSKRLDVESVTATLALADQHHCEKLKDACIGFINSSDAKDLVESKGYEHLKRACPDVFVDIWERAAKSCKL
ncbi:hypothetical protein BS78_K171600 [Paspalum vaginatum]|uniref:BTB domain-containing protein n=1 Tax=Paspalum vaginatum TaxID=158149 RepID=A0A9W7XCC7_9POAL|nr:hypothetical protein BS78_K171600 [Paspalum vaginatum]